MTDKLLKRTTQSCRLINLRYSLAEIASIAGISERTAQYHSKDIERYWSEESITPDDDKKFILKRSIDIGIGKLSGNDEQTLKHIIGVILGTHLKVTTNLLDEAGSLMKVWTIGKYITEIHMMICRYKNRSIGVPIHSDNNPYAKYLLSLKNMSKASLDKLFLRSEDYQVGKYSKRWSSTELLEKYAEVYTQELSDMISKFGISDPVNLPLISHMLLQKGATQETGQGNSKNNISNIYSNKSTKKSYLTIDYNNISTMLIAKMSVIKQFEPSSKFSLLTQAVMFTKDEIHIPIKHKAKSSEYLGRTYNVFCSLRSKERLELGYISYDMSAAMQSICLHLIKANAEDYPMLWNYTKDNTYKKKFRAEIAKALDIDIDEVKSKLTAFANGSTLGKNKHLHYKIFQEESDKLRRQVLKHIREYEPQVLDRANEQSRKAKELPEELDWLDIESKETSKEARAKASVFFFVWTWYERQIRQAMLDILEDGIEVHDAVYSQMDIPVHRIQNNILQQTGFDIIIEKEMPLKFIE